MAHTKSQLNVLALNTGSSSLKFGLYDVGASRIERLLSGEVVSIGDKSTRCNAEDSQGSVLLAETSPITGQREAIIRIGRLIVDCKMPVPAAIGHRIVHGGEEYGQTRLPLGLTITVARQQSNTISELSFLAAVHTAKGIARREGISEIFACK